MPLILVFCLVPAVLRVSAPLRENGLALSHYPKKLEWEFPGVPTLDTIALQAYTVHML